MSAPFIEEDFCGVDPSGLPEPIREMIGDGFGSEECGASHDHVYDHYSDQPAYEDVHDHWSDSV